MSSFADTEGYPMVPKGHVKVWTTAKSFPQWEIKVVVGDTPEMIESAKAIALAAYESLEERLTGES